MRRVILTGVAAVLVLLAASTGGGSEAAMAAKPPSPGSFSLTLSSATVDFGLVDPEIDFAVPAAVDVTVAGFKLWGTMELSYAATAFTNTNPAAGTPTMPVSVMRYAVSGAATIPETQMTGGGVLNTVDIVDITKNNWDYTYTVAYTINVPFDYEAGSYQSQILYTATVY